VPYQLLEEFRRLFERQIYRHRSSQQGDRVAYQLYEDLLALGRSAKLSARISDGTRVVNTRNRVTGRHVRRGDGTFGERLPHVDADAVPGYSVRRGPIANIEIAAETKILATAIGKQVQERISSLTDQATVFRNGNPNVICVAIVGINYAPSYLAYEGVRTQLTDGSKYAHPIQQAANAEAKVRLELQRIYEEVIVLPFVATNQPPLDFQWANLTKVQNEYGAALIRISQEYERRF
jgi:hypothetical protein